MRVPSLCITQWHKGLYCWQQHREYLCFCESIFSPIPLSPGGFCRTGTLWWEFLLCISALIPNTLWALLFRNTSRIALVCSGSPCATLRPLLQHPIPTPFVSGSYRHHHLLSLVPRCPPDRTHPGMWSAGAAQRCCPCSPQGLWSHSWTGQGSSSSSDFAENKSKGFFPVVLPDTARLQPKHNRIYCVLIPHF